MSDVFGEFVSLKEKENRLIMAAAALLFENEHMSDQDLAEAIGVNIYYFMTICRQVRDELNRRRFYENKYWNEVFEQAVDLYHTYGVMTVEMMKRSLNVDDARALDLMRHMRAVNILKTEGGAA